ncbi:MAG TPA: hypothetical protein PKE12_10370 [Kiritimatiellia bacterium]|nr:hypothetical protein [Kiritimatiellia bacterium]
MMRIATVHYHLRPGGVSRVMESAKAALRDAPFELALLAGDTVAALDYAPEPARTDPALLADQLEAAARAALGGAPDLWHIHNHSLGRNPSAAAAFTELARRGHRLLLQVHDFAEDGRPANYRLLRDHLGGALAATLYPEAAHVHYAVLNPRDRAALAAAGVPRDRLHDLPNPVLPLAGTDTSATQTGAQPPLVLYPTRAIRRKNIGEFLLWAALETGDRRYALTLAPTTPSDRAPYEEWKAFAYRLRLPVDFEAGLQPGETLETLRARADCVATTSVAEGFGLAFTEPWLANRALAGRALPEITADMEAAGLDLTALYTRLEFPLEWVGAETLRARIDAALQRMAVAYDVPMAADAADRAWHAFIAGDRVDFGRLDEPMQAAVIERIRAAPDLRRAIYPARLDSGSKRERIAANRAVVARTYDLSGYARRLAALYATVGRTEPGPVRAYDADAVRRFFLDPARLFLLRSP